MMVSFFSRHINWSFPSGGELICILYITAETISSVSDLHRSVVPAAAVVAVVIFALLAVAVWFLFRRNSARFRGLPALGGAYYRQTDSQGTESDGNVLIADLEAHSGE